MTHVTLKMCVLIVVLCLAAADKMGGGGGKSAAIGQFKYVVYIHANVTTYTNESVNSSWTSCTGLIVTRRYVVAPSHCLREILPVDTETDNTGMVSSSVTVRAGTLLGSSSRYLDYGNCMQERIAPVNQILSPPSMTPSNDTEPSGGGDIVILLVGPPFDFDACVAAVRIMKKPFPTGVLPFCLSVSFSNSRATGEVSEQVLKYRRVSAGDATFCSDLPQSTDIPWRDDHVCSRTLHVINTCVEDWTGPLLCKSRGGFTAVGIDTFYFGQKVTSECEETNKVYKAYTMLGYYEEWIRQSIDSSDLRFEVYKRPIFNRQQTRDASFLNSANRERGPRVAMIFLLIYLMMIT